MENAAPSSQPARTPNCALRAPSGIRRVSGRRASPVAALPTAVSEIDPALVRAGPGRTGRGRRGRSVGLAALLAARPLLALRLRGVGRQKGNDHRGKHRNGEQTAHVSFPVAIAQVTTGGALVPFTFGCDAGRLRRALLSPRSPWFTLGCCRNSNSKARFARLRRHGRCRPLSRPARTADLRSAHAGCDCGGSDANQLPFAPKRAAIEAGAQPTALRHVTTEPRQREGDAPADDRKKSGTSPGT